MIGSANEIAALATKAARGAGAPPAQAAQFGQALVRWLATGYDPTKEIIETLEALPEGPIFWLPSNLLRLLEEGTGRFRNGVLSQDAPKGLTEGYLDALPFRTSYVCNTETIDVTIDTEHPAERFTVNRITLSDRLAHHFQILAARTFVPETEASRLAGAGAGLTDND